MSFGRKPRREGRAQWGEHERYENKNHQAVAHMRDGSIVAIESLAHQVKLAQSGKVRIFGWLDELKNDSDKGICVGRAGD